MKKGETVADVLFFTDCVFYSFLFVLLVCVFSLYSQEDKKLSLINSDSCTCSYTQLLTLIHIYLYTATFSHPLSLYQYLALPLTQRAGRRREGTGGGGTPEYDLR